MKMLVVSRKIIFSMFMMLVLICGLQGVSYAGVCRVGDVLSPGESCTYVANGANVTFSVKADGDACRAGGPVQRVIFGITVNLEHFEFCTGNDIERDDTFNSNFSASRNANSSWTINTVPGTAPPPVQKPDLVVKQPTVSKSTLAPGENFTVSATVTNQDAGSAASTTLRYYRSTNTTISSSDTEVGTDSVNALGANRSSVESITLTAPTSAGTYYYGACVEAVTGESRSDNNCSAAVSITVQQSTQPVGQTTYSVGEDIPTLPTGSWYPDVVRSTGGGVTFILSGGEATGTFGNGGSIIKDGITYTCVAAGGCTIEGRRVTRGTIQASGGGQTPPPAQKPDLVVKQPTVSKSTLAPGENFTLSATVTNQDAGSAASTTLRYYRSTNTTISSSDTEVGTDSVNALGSNRSSAESINLTAPTSAGTYYYGACVEAVTGESRSDNNCSAAVSITVQEAPVVSTPSHPFIYWTDAGIDKIQRANLDGSNIEDLVTGLDTPIGIALDVAGGKIYWIDSGGTDKIQRANLDGSNVEDLVTGLDTPVHIALDVAGGKMYWTEEKVGKIQRADLDGSNVEDLVTGLGTAQGVALDVAGGKIYWTNPGIDKIQRANLDGSNIEDLVTQGLSSPFDIALDVTGGKMYWTDQWTDKIQRANLDGSNVEDLVTQGLHTPFGIALDVTGGKMYWTDPGVLNRLDREKIQCANLDGSNVQDLVTQGLGLPVGIAIGTSAQASPPIAREPDLVLESVEAQPSTVDPGQEFRLYATLRNNGTQASTATTVRYYQSTDAIISTTDTQLGTDRRNPLAANASIRRFLNVTAPTTPGTYYYGVCVDSVTNESNTANNCSAAVSITVRGAPVVSTALDTFIYWTDWGTDKIQRANLDGSNVQDLVTTGLDVPRGIALDVVGGKMYWTDWGTDKIQRANLDGSNVQDLVTTGLDVPRGIALDVVGGKMYWTDVGTEKIQRANLDGSNIEDLITGLQNLHGIALDVAGGKMYWTDGRNRAWRQGGGYIGRDKIRRANLDGSNIEDLVTHGLESPQYIALDVAGGKMYWTNYTWDGIRRANLDGSNVEDLVKAHYPSGIALDVAGGKMYWPEWTRGKIRRANLDGSNVEDLVTQGLDQPRGIAIGISAQPLSPIAREDVNRDGVVDVQDLGYVGLQYGKTGTNAADVNGDNIVNVDDFILVAAAVDAAAAAAPAARAQVQSHFTAKQLQGWLTEARASRNTSFTYRRGIAVIERLLALVAPEETALLANYPNPFNPETWIPYHLANDSDVSLSIYDINGALVRELDLGHQRAGYYTDRSRAAYWDGRNEFGETVAGGVYFYQLQAGDYSQMRKMVILK